MFNSVGFPEVLVLALIGLVLFGPHKLPGMLRDAGRMLKQIRKMATEAARDIKEEMGPEMAGVSLRSMNPKQIVKDLMLADDPVAAAPVATNGNGSHAAAAAAAPTTAANPTTPAPRPAPETPGSAADSLGDPT
jgi:sec-independent protein translocase protein TatB